MRFSFNVKLKETKRLTFIIMVAVAVANKELITLLHSGIFMQYLNNIWCVCVVENGSAASQQPPLKTNSYTYYTQTYVGCFVIKIN